ncbi:hypothetical protein [Sphingomonas nostoxanthinifaciens]|uniref:hypothetical protein n=1 Tax=Sphingomonas nostoxanthinifaciens TaxID=2872652 RepID=UPI001CC1CFE9|nr:hypothetical protein [Sphingomonas nostoxanthinifaciens]UAK25745.1 hypothetical protein K8P63_06325 [Sphingomonas nostoxanthinifaciens]
MFKSVVALTASAVVVTSLYAAAPVIQPVQIGAETVRFVQGVPTLDLQMPTGAVQITPLGFDHGGITFGIAVLNNSDHPSNIGVENVSVVSDNQPVLVFTAQQLQQKAKNRAMWATIALAAAGGLATAASANQRTHYNAVTTSPWGTVATQVSYRSTADELQTAALAAGTAASIVAVQNKLDHTMQAIGSGVVQTTTVAPGDSYAGRIALDKVKGKVPFRVVVTVDWNGAKYPFQWQVAPAGTPAPVFAALTPATPPPVAPVAASTVQNAPAALPASAAPAVIQSAPQAPAPAAKAIPAAAVKVTA